MAKQLHKQFSNEEVKEVFEKYIKKVFELGDALAFLKIGRSRFFDLLKRYQKDPEGFSIEFKRRKAPNGLDAKSEKKIVHELKKEANLIADKRNPIRFFNYSYLREVLEKKHGVSVSLPTIISRAKKMGITKRGRN
jgi:hypothetical protein